MRVTGRAVLAALLHLAFFLVPVAVVAVPVATAVLDARHDLGAAARSGVVVVAVAAVVVVWLRAVTRARPRWRGVRLTSTDQPQLWRTVTKLADGAGTDAPDEIRIVSEVTSRIRPEARLLGLRRGRYHLELGLPLLAGLSVVEFRAVLAHELSLLGGGGSRLRALVRRSTIAVERSVEAMTPGAMKWLFTGYARLFARIAAPVNRALEVRADAVAAALAGNRAAASAARRVGGLELAWQDYCHRYLKLAPLAGRTPDLLLGFRSFLNHPERADQLDEYAERALDQDHSTPHLPRPTGRQRFAVIARLADTKARKDNRPAWSVLKEPRASVPELEGRLLVDGLGPRVQWPELVRLAGAAHSRNRAGLLASAVHRTGCAPDTTIQGVLLAVHRGHGTELADTVLDPGLTAEEVDENAPHLLSELLGEAVVSALVAAGRARHQLDWEQAWRVRLADGTELNATELVRPAVDNPAFVPGLHRALVQLGVALDYAPPPAEDPAANLLGIATAVHYAGRTHELLVYDQGLLLLPTSGGAAHRLLAGALARARRSEEEQLDALSATPLTELQDRTDAVWVETRDIGHARLTRQRSGWSLITEVYAPTEDGEEEVRDLTVHSTANTDERGDTYAGLVELMGARLDTGELDTNDRQAS